MKSLLVLGLYFSEDCRRIAFDGIVQDRGQRRAGIFDVGVNAVGEQRLLADVTSGEIETALDAQDGCAPPDVAPEFLRVRACSGKFFEPTTMVSARRALQPIEKRRE